MSSRTGWSHLRPNTVGVATPAGFEPATSRLEGECSIQLSYGVAAGIRARVIAPDDRGGNRLRANR